MFYVFSSTPLSSPESTHILFPPAPRSSPLYFFARLVFSPYTGNGSPRPVCPFFRVTGGRFHALLFASHRSRYSGALLHVAGVTNASPRGLNRSLGRLGTPEVPLDDSVSAFLRSSFLAPRQKSPVELTSVLGFNFHRFPYIDWFFFETFVPHRSLE